MKTIFFFIIFATLSGCKGKPQSEIGDDSAPVVQLNKTSPMANVVGSWKGIGSKSVVDLKNTFSNCEKVSVTIRALSASHFSMKDQFTCDRGAHVFTSGISQFDTADQVVYMKGQPVGSIAPGNVNIRFYQGTTDVQLVLSVDQNRMHYEYISQTNGKSITTSADLVQ